MERIVLRGKSAARGVAEGEAMVTHDGMCFLSDINIRTGVVSEPTFELRGKNVAGKVLVFPMGRGSTGDPYGLYMLTKAGKNPIAIVNTEASPTTVTGAVISRVPMVYKLDRDPLEVIETGDHVLVDGDRGIVEVTKKP